MTTMGQKISKWCRGKRGQDHQYELKDQWAVAEWNISVHTCTNCGKKRWRHEEAVLG